MDLSRPEQLALRSDDVLVKDVHAACRGLSIFSIKALEAKAIASAMAATFCSGSMSPRAIRRTFLDHAPEFIEEIVPVRVHVLDQPQLPGPVPFPPAPPRPPPK